MPTPCYAVQSFASLKAAVAEMDFPDARLTAPVLGIPHDKGEQRCQAVGGNAEGKVPTTAPACASESPGSNTAAGAEMPLCRPTRGSIYLAHVWPIRGGCSRCGEPFPPFPFK